ncbi:MAG: Asp-tRNA(Asn)/Glu-tRNA(Gln) amidotransferase subunit GatC [Patescibacteria group bacterium]|nr:Asp-tRNA(Asn)/Glu-tRNA(Gln) amidotransferase subunit GatC [Patescibacteria group bacterium]
MKLKREEIKYIADLARLELTDEELKKYGSQLSAVLNYFEQLKEVDTIDIEPTAQVTGLENALREDVKEDWNKIEAGEALRQAPELENEQIKVKRVLG